MSENTHTPITQLGEFGLIDRLVAPFSSCNSSTSLGPGDDSAVIDTGSSTYQLFSTELMLEGVHFDLTYFPLQHLGFKAVVAGISDILAMNGTPRQVTISLGISSRFSVEMVERIYHGVHTACEQYRVDLVGGDTTASVNGLTLSVAAIGEVDREKIVYRSGAREHDLICLTGDLGGAYMGLHLLEREKHALEGHPNPQPHFEGHEYILGRQLRPLARVDVIEELNCLKIVPSAMIDISDGLSSELLHLCKSSVKGARIYLNRLPIAQGTSAMAQELCQDPVVAALNGGEDYELLFTVPPTLQKEVESMGADIIGHITAPEAGAMLVTPDDQLIEIQAQGWVWTASHAQQRGPKPGTLGEPQC